MEVSRWDCSKSCKFQKASRLVAVVADPIFWHLTYIGECPECKSRLGLTGQSATWKYKVTFCAAKMQVPTRIAPSHRLGSTVVQVNLQ